MIRSLSPWSHGFRLLLAVGLLIALAIPGIAQEKPEEARAYLTSPNSGAIFVEKGLTLEAVTVDGTDQPVSHVEFLSGDEVIAAAKRPADQPPSPTGGKVLFKTLWERPALGIQTLQVRALSGDKVVALSERVRVLLVGIPQPPPAPTLRIAIASPESGTRLPAGDPVEITAKVSSTEPVDIVSFFAVINGRTEEIGSLTQEPWQVTWKPTTPGLGALYAKVGTRSGSAKSDAVPVMVIGFLPPLPPVASVKVGLLSPKIGEILKPGSSIQVTAEAAGTEPVESVTFFAVIDGDRKEIGTDSESPWEVSWTVPEAHDALLMAEARSKTAKAISMPVPVRIQSEPEPREPLTWLKPHGGLDWIAGVPLPLVVQADEAKGAFKAVEFFDGETSLGEGKRLPSGDLGITVPSLFVLDWTGKAGTHVLSAVGHRVDGTVERVSGPTLTLKDPGLPPRPAWVRVTRPALGEFVTSPKVALEAVVFETQDTVITSVEFVVDADVVATVERPANTPEPASERKIAFAGVWASPQQGMHSLHVRALKGKEIVAKSEPVRFVVGEAKPPVPPDLVAKVAIVSPRNGDRLPAGQPIEIRVNSNTSEPLESVEFLAIAKGELVELGTLTQEPWNFTWKEPAEGLVLLFVRAKIAGEPARSHPVLVVVGDGVVWNPVLPGIPDIGLPGSGILPDKTSQDPNEPRIAPLRPSRDGHHELVVVGGGEGTLFDVEVSDDLVRWTRIVRGVLSLGSTLDLQAQTGGRLGQFYRLVPAAP
ncbi:MAG: Ig-like domain-containing protein [Limisphaerales bacterium]